MSLSLSAAVPAAAFFTGIDWAAASHAVCVVDNAGHVKCQFIIEHSAAGFRPVRRQTRNVREGAKKLGAEDAEAPFESAKERDGHAKVEAGHDPFGCLHAAFQFGSGKVRGREAMVEGRLAKLGVFSSEEGGMGAEVGVGLKKVRAPYAALGVVSDQVGGDADTFGAMSAQAGFMSVPSGFISAASR